MLRNKVLKISIGVFCTLIFAILVVLTVPGEEKPLGNPNLEWASFFVSIAGLVISFVGTGFSIYFAWRAHQRAESSKD